MTDQQTRHARARRSDPTGWIVATIVLAVSTVGLGGVLLASSGSEEAPSTDSAAASAELGCRLLAQLPEGGFDGEAADVADSHRLTTIGSLGYLAGEQDDDYDDLADKLGELMNAAATMSMAEADFPGRLDAARDACGDHGF